ncbi:MAG: DUF4258 domain-containing protein [Lachnospirales bacterium]
MIDIETLKKYYINDMVIVSEHASERFRQRNIKAREIKQAVFNGEIIEQYPDDFPFPSCLILGKTTDEQYIHIVMSDEGSMSRIITAYYPDKNKWSTDFKTRKEQIKL